MKKADSVPTITNDWGEDVYTRLSWFRSDKVKSARVMVVGCGALGNEVLKNLALFGIEQIVVVDYDRVEPSNLTRSILFSREDSGKPKVAVVARKLRAINPAIRVLEIDGDIAYQVGLGLLRRMDVVIGCVDNRLARYFLNRLCMRAGVPWVDGGIDGLEGTARVFIPGKNCYACNLGPEALKELALKISCASIIRRNVEADRVATTPVIASIIGAVEVQEAMKLLHPEELEKGVFTSLCGKMFYYEGERLSSRLVDFRGYDEDCPVHVCWTLIRETDLSVEREDVHTILSRLVELLDVSQVTICLRNHSFVDILEVREEGRIVRVMLPDYAVAAFVDADPDLRGLPSTAFYQREYREIGQDFPYQELTLRQIGVPIWDVLHVNTEKGTFYVELMNEWNDSGILFQKEVG